jgi:phasin family protein
MFMSNELFQGWTKFSTASFGAAQELAEIYSKSYTKLSEKQLSLAKSFLDGSVEQTKVISETKGPKEFFAAQAKWVADGAEKWQAAARETVSLIEATQGELTAWVEKSTTAAMEPISKAASFKKAA